MAWAMACAAWWGGGGALAASEAGAGSVAIVASGFVFERAPFASAHASTIVETRDGLLAAWFGGPEEGHRDVSIWIARHDGTRWLAPVEVADGRQADGSRFPCWNPVLFQPSNGAAAALLQGGPEPARVVGPAAQLERRGTQLVGGGAAPAGILGPIRAKPVELPDGTLVAGSSTEHAGWVVHIERATLGDLGSAAAWWKSGPLNDPKRSRRSSRRSWSTRRRGCSSCAAAVSAW